MHRFFLNLSILVVLILPTLSLAQDHAPNTSNALGASKASGASNASGTSGTSNASNTFSTSDALVATSPTPQNTHQGHPRPLRIEGSTTIYPIMQAVADHITSQRPEVALQVTPSGSGTGIDALIGGMADVAMSSRALLPAERKKAAAKGVTLQQHPVGLDGIVPIVNLANPVSGLTIEQLADIYAGRITNWAQVGGEPGAITVISRDSSSGTFGIWKDAVLGGGRLAPLVRFTDSSATMLWDVSVNKTAIGYEGMGYVDRTKVKPLAVNGLRADTATILAGDYPLTRQLFVLTADQPAGLANELTKELLNTLQSATGQQIVAAKGFVPLPPPTDTLAPNTPATTTEDASGE